MVVSRSVPIAGAETPDTIIKSVIIIEIKVQIYYYAYYAELNHII